MLNKECTFPTVLQILSSPTIPRLLLSTIFSSFLMKCRAGGSIHCWEFITVPLPLQEFVFLFGKESFNIGLVKMP